MKNLKCEIIAVGNELLFGETINTNATFLSKQMSVLGIEITKHTVVADDEEMLLSAIKSASENNDIILFSGGLGPTDDDLTKEVVTKFLEDDLVVDDYSLKAILDYFEINKITMSKNNEKQALRPSKGHCLENINGTAPGIYVEKNGVHYFLLPGPPNELKPLFYNKVIPILNEVNDMKMYSKTISIMGIGESLIAQRLGELLSNDSNPKVAPYASPGIVKFKITAYGEDDENLQNMVENKSRELYPVLKDYIFTEENKSIEEVIIDKLKSLEKTLSIAESCTGGMISSALVDIPSASEVFLKANITYSNASKINDIGVDANIISEFGAVSEQCAKAMAEGVKNSCGSDYGLSVTGIAGPDGGSDEKPVGTVFIAVANEKNTIVKKYNFSGSRNRIRFFATRYALVNLLKNLIN